MNLSIPRLCALQKMPYMASLLFALKPEEKQLGTTMAVCEDGMLYYDPEFIRQADLSNRQIGGEMLHECMHLLRRHPLRRRTLKPSNMLRWATATDLEIDDDLKAAGVKMFEGGVDHRKLEVPEGKIAEWYYSNLKQKHVGHACYAGCFSQASKQSKPSLAIEMAIENTAKAIAKQIKEKGQGSVPAGLRKLADLINGKLNWQTLLRRYVGAALGKPEAVDLTFRRINRRQGGIGYGPGKPILYGYHNPLPKVCVAIDTSGSMYDGKSIDQCLGELSKILQALGGEVYLITGDAKVHAQANVRDITQARKMIQGGGGTDFQPLFKAATKTRADLFVYLTDGYGTAPEKAPRFPVVWCLVGSMKSRPAGWGRYVEVETT